MPGYAASATLQGIGPHVVGPRPAQGARAVPVATSASAPRPLPALDDWIELVGRPLDERFADWWGGLCEALSQMTFFLFDPESWR
jgi:hypothetical protein